MRSCVFPFAYAAVSIAASMRSLNIPFLNESAFLPRNGDLKLDDEMEVNQTVTCWVEAMNALCAMKHNNEVRMIWLLTSFNLRAHNFCFVVE